MDNNPIAPILAFCMVVLLLILAFVDTHSGGEDQQEHPPVPEAVPSIVVMDITMKDSASSTDHLPDTLANTLVDPFEPLDIALPIHLQEHTWQEAQRIGIDPEILLRLMWRESGFQVDAWCIDSNGYESVGLCQINGIAFDWCRDRDIDPYTPEGNITAAAELIQYYINERGCSLEEALAAYGAGETGMRSGKGLEAARKLLEEELPMS